MVSMIRNWRAPLFVAILAVILGWRTLSLPWSLIDDHAHLRVADSMAQAARTGNWAEFFPTVVDAGRARPGYWITWWLPYEAFGLNPLAFHAVRLVQFALAGALAVSLARHSLEQSEWVSLVSGLLFVGSGVHIELWQRLGPQEPLLVISLGGSLWAMQHVAQTIRAGRNPIGWFILAVLCVLAGYTFKETALVMLPISLVVWWATYRDWPSVYSFRWRQWAVAYIVVCGIATLVLGVAVAYAIAHRPPGTYSGFYSLDGISLTARAFSYAFYTWYPYLFLSPILLFVGLKWWRSALYESMRPILLNGWVWVWMTWLLVFYVMQIPWGLPQSYYTLILTFALCPWLALGVMLFVRVIRQSRKKVERLVLVGILAFCISETIIQNAWQMNAYLDWITQRHAADTALVSFLAEHADPAQALWFDADPKHSEVAAAVADQLEFLYNKPCPKSFYLTSQSHLQAGDWVLSYNGALQFRDKLQLIAKVGEPSVQWSIYRWLPLEYLEGSSGASPLSYSRLLLAKPVIR
jgi:hypothetical protein